MRPRRSDVIRRSLSELTTRPATWYEVLEGTVVKDSELHAKNYLRSLRLSSATGTFPNSHRCWYNLAPVMKIQTT